jgi:hypothetical protein
LGLASIVHGPGDIVANTKFTPDTCTTFGGGRTKVHRPEPSEGEASAMAAQQTPPNASDKAAEEMTSVRIMPGL